MLQFGHEEDVSIPPIELDRTAGVLTIVGCLATFLAAILPSIEKATLAASLITVAVADAGVLLAVLAVISGGIAGAVLLRRPVSGGLAMLLIVLAGAQLGVAIWDGETILQAIGRADSHQVLIRSIGSGAYLGVLGAGITVAGGVVAWIKRSRR